MDNSAKWPTGVSSGTIVVADDDPFIRAIIQRALEREGHRVVQCASGKEALEYQGDSPSAVCLDLGLGDMSGLEVIGKLMARYPDLPIVVITARDDAETAVTAMHAGAYDYLVKPIDCDRLLYTVRRALQHHLLSRQVRELHHELEDRKVLGSIVGQSPPMRELARQVERVLASDVAVCLFGESGTGKELVAHAVHNGGRRKDGPFVAINCAAIPESLQESELFGHERGSFTGAASTYKGRFEQASGGTLFLDEVGEMSASTQAKLLRTIQERTVRRVGGTSEIPVDARIVCATHRNLEQEVRSGRFREDLYFRLVVYPISLPPLRSRRDDIPLLVSHFLTKLAPDTGRNVRRVSSDALDALARYPFPGNVRELENIIHRALLACEGDELGLLHLSPSVREHASQPPPAMAREPKAVVRFNSEAPVLPLRELERRAIQHALRAAGGSVGKAAKLLGIGRATLYRRLSELETYQASA